MASTSIVGITSRGCAPRGFLQSRGVIRRRQPTAPAGSQLLQASHSSLDLLHVLFLTPSPAHLGQLRLGEEMKTFDWLSLGFHSSTFRVESLKTSHKGFSNACLRRLVEAVKKASTATKASTTFEIVLLAAANFSFTTFLSEEAPSVASLNSFLSRRSPIETAVTTELRPHRCSDKTTTNTATSRDCSTITRPKPAVVMVDKQ
ncbi:hypothetical protein IWX49DRAFT_383952 [Phyllosticta citricarpa]